MPSWNPKWAYTAIGTVLGCTVLVSGCAPSQQPSTSVNQEVGKPVGVEAWNGIVHGARLGAAANKYMMMTNVSIIQGAIHDNFSIYGGINPPDTASFGVNETGNYIQYYQLGQNAYVKDNGRWSQTQPHPNLNVFNDYVSLTQSAASRQLPISQLKQAYVVDEYCDVFRTTVPADIAERVPDWLHDQPKSTLGDVQYTFYIGQKDHCLRKVSTVSVSGLSNIGSMQVNSDTTLFDINQQVAKVTLPKDLVKQLENLPT